MSLVPLSVILAVVGAYIGSFLNVCIYRMPAHKSVVFPGSACPACGRPIPLWHNIPILSWLILRGKCATCRAPIAPRYLFVEALTAACFAGAALRFGPDPWELTGALILVSALIVLFFTDLDERILPDLVTLPGIAAGLVFSVHRAEPHPFTDRAALGRGAAALAFAAMAAVGAGGALWLIGRLWRFVRPEIESAMGMGDVKMMAMVGAFLGGRLALLTVFLGSLLGTAIFVAARALVLVLPKAHAGAGPARGLQRGLESAGFLVEGRGAGMMDQIPFGSMLAVGAAVALFWGEAIVTAYARLAGLSA